MVFCYSSSNEPRHPLNSIILKIKSDNDVTSIEPAWCILKLQVMGEVLIVGAVGAVTALAYVTFSLNLVFF